MLKCCPGKEARLEATEDLSSGPAQRVGKAILLTCGILGLALCVCITALIFVRGLPLLLRKDRLQFCGQAVAPTS